MAGPRGRGDRSRPAEGEPDRRLCRHQQRRVPHAGGGRGKTRRSRGMPLRPQRHEPERRRRARLLRAGGHGAGEGGRRRLRVVARLGPRRGGGPPGGKGGPCARRRRAGHPERTHLRTPRRFDDAVPRRAVQSVRRVRERLRARRGVRRRGAEAAPRGRGRRGPDLGCDPRRLGESRRRQRRPDGTQRARARPGHGRGAVRRGRRPGRGGLHRGSRDGDHGRRPDRDQRGGGGLREGASSRTSAARRLRQDQPRSPGVGGRHRGAHQGGARGAAGRDSPAPAFQRPQPEPRLGTAPDPGDLGDDGLAPPERPAPFRRSELLRDLRDELPPDRRGVPRRRGPAATGRPARRVHPAGHGW